MPRKLSGGERKKISELKRTNGTLIYERVNSFKQKHQKFHRSDPEHLVGRFMST